MTWKIETTSRKCKYRDAFKCLISLGDTNVPYMTEDWDSLDNCTKDNCPLRVEGAAYLGKTDCSNCEGKKALYESVANPGTYYCDSCATYVMMEYGASRVKTLPSPPEE